MAAALKRAVRLGEPIAAPRISDLGAIVASTAGKIELETLGDETREDKVIEKLVAARRGQRLQPPLLAVASCVGLVERFEDGAEVEVGDAVPSDAA